MFSVVGPRTGNNLPEAVCSVSLLSSWFSHVETSNGLLDELISADCISSRHAERITACLTASVEIRASTVSSPSAEVIGTSSLCNFQFHYKAPHQMLKFRAQIGVGDCVTEKNVGANAPTFPQHATHAMRPKKLTSHARTGKLLKITDLSFKSHSFKFVTPFLCKV